MIPNNGGVVTEERMGEIALLLIEAMPFTGYLFDGPTVQELDEFKEEMADFAKKIWISIAEFGSIFRPGFDKMLNLIFPENTKEIFFRRDSKAKKIAILVWEFRRESRFLKSPKAFLNFIIEEVAVAKISDEEIHEWAESFFKPI